MLTVIDSHVFCWAQKQWSVRHGSTPLWVVHMKQHKPVGFLLCLRFFYWSPFEQLLPRECRESKWIRALNTKATAERLQFYFFWKLYHYIWTIICMICLFKADHLKPWRCVSLFRSTKWQKRNVMEFLFLVLWLCWTVSDWESAIHKLRLIFFGPRVASGSFPSCQSVKKKGLVSWFIRH